MAKYFIKSTKENKYLKILGVTANQTKYGWADTIENATNFRYQVSVFKQLALLRSTKEKKWSGLIVIKEESTGKIFEVADLEIEV